MLVEQTSVPPAALPVAEFKDHLRLGTGFTDDGVQDSVLEGTLRAAIAAIEGRTGKVLIARSYVWTLTAWRSPARQLLPVAPVASVDEIRTIDAQGNALTVDPQRTRVAPDSQRPALLAAQSSLPAIPRGGTAEIRFTAGYGASWSELPPDLGQAVLLLAAHFYEHRSVLSDQATPMPFGVSLLIDRYRTVRLFGEAAL